MNNIEKLIEALSNAGLINKPENAEEMLTAEGIADALWFLLYVHQKQGELRDDASPQDQLSQKIIIDNVAQEAKPEVERKAPSVTPPINEQVDNSTELHTHRSTSPLIQNLEGHEATLVRSPGAPALPSKLEIARALRPLMQPISSYTRFILNEQATTHHIAETLILDKQAATHHSTKTRGGSWSPIMKPALTRWLDVALVVDVGTSMTLWRQTIDELRILLEHQGAFRDVRVWQLATDEKDHISLYAGTSPNAQKRNPQELIDPTGRRLILLVSDCVSPAWHSGKVQQKLDLWGKSNVVTLVHVFPRRMWSSTALRTADIVGVRTTKLIRGNAGIVVQKEPMDFEEEGVAQGSAIKPSLPIPIITLEPEVIANWAHMIVGKENAWTLGAIFYQDLLALSEDEFSTQERVTSAEELVEQFCSTASPTAQELLKFLSAAPISLPVIRQIQRVMLPHAQQIHFAEVFLSGLFKEISRDETTNDPDYVEYDFLDGVREVLQETILVPDEFKVIDAVSKYLGNRYGHLSDFYTRATTLPDVKGNASPIDAKSRPFARIVASAWRHLGGTYAIWADNLEREDAPPEPIEPASDSISQVAEDALPSPKAENHMREEASSKLREPAPKPISINAEDTLPVSPPIASLEGLTLLHTFKGHKSIIKAASWSPDGTLLACGSIDGTVQVCSASQGQSLYPPLRGHTSAIRSVTWSSDGKRLTSRSSDGATRVWDASQGKLLDRSRPTMNETSLERRSPNGQLTAISPGDRRIRIWKQKGSELQYVLIGHTGQITAVSWSLDSKLLASGANDGTVRIWDMGQGEASHILEGYTGDVKSVAWSPDGKLLAFSSIARNSPHTTNTHIYRTDTWEPVANLPDLKGEVPVAWHPCPSDTRFPYLATAGQQPEEILIWQLDIELLCNTPSPDVVHYANAKVVLVGESGVGKSGLSLVLTGRTFVPTESTHNRHVWLLDKKEVQQDGLHETREIWLWDLAGQPDYQLIHLLHLHEATVALIVFDASRESDPFAGILHWQHALQLAQQERDSSALPLTTWLVAARIDRGGRSISRARIDNLVKELGCAGYIETSAKEGIGIAELGQAIRAKIDWAQLPKVTSTRLLYSIKTFMLNELQAGRLLRTADELYEAFLHTKNAPTSNSELRQQFTIVLGQLVAQGIIRSLGFGNLVLLQPERLDSYASALLIAVKNEPDELGSIAETRVLQGQFKVPAEDRLVNTSQEKLLLIAMIDELVRHEIALREGGFLVFPSQSTREHPAYDALVKKQTVIFTFTGSVLSLYTTLVVRIAQSGIFHKQGLWRYVVTYTTQLDTSGTYGLLLSPKGEEQAELGVFFDEHIGEEMRYLFEDFVYTYLERRTTMTVQRRRNFVCPNCGEIFTEAQISKRRERGFKFIRCNTCDTEVSLLDGIQRLATSTTRVKEMEQMADDQRDRESAALILQGKIATHDFDVFLCYNRQNASAVLEISEQLKSQSILPQLDEWYQRSSLNWKKLLEERIVRFKTVVFFVGKEGISQGWPQQEFITSSRDFIQRDSPMILVLLPGAPQASRLPSFLNNMVWIDFRVNDPDPMQQLLEKITDSKETG